MATIITTATTNFDKTLTALVLRDIADNIRRKALWLQPGSFIRASLIEGTNLVRHISYGDLSIVAPAQADGTVPWLTEGTPPTSEDLSIGYDEFSVNQLGRLVKVSDRALKYNPHNLMAIASERVASNAILTIDAVIASVVTTITATYAGGLALATLTTSNYLTGALVRLMRAQLMANGIPPIFGNDYGAMVHPYAIYDLMADAAWQDAAKYASPENLLSGEVGRLYGVRFIENTVGTWVSNGGGAGTNLPVYSTMFFGREYFAVGDFGSIESHMVRPGGDHTDPLAQSALVGWKGWIGADVLTTLGTRARRLVHTGSVAGAASI